MIMLLVVCLSLLTITEAQFEYDPEKYDSEIDYAFTLLDSFLEGLKADTFAESATDCADDLRDTV